MSRIGIELTARHAHVVRLSPFGRVVECTSLTWDSSDVAEVCSRVAERFPGPHEVAICLSHELLSIVHVTLPPASQAAREQMLDLEPDRYLASLGPSRIALAPRSDMAFSLAKELIERILSAFGRLGHVVRCEPSALSLARALGRTASGMFRIPAEASVALVSLHNGAIQQIRRDHDSVGDGMPLSPVRGTPPLFVPAVGAALGSLDDQAGSFLSVRERKDLIRSERRSTITAVVALVAALVTLGSAVDRSRAREFTALQQRADSLEQAAKPAIDQLQRLFQLNEEAALLRSTGSNVSRVLAAISRRLPEDAMITSLRMRDGTWEIDGTARNAAKIVPALTAETLFVGVSSRAASARFVEAAGTRETFSILFHVQPR